MSAASLKICTLCQHASREVDFQRAHAVRGERSQAERLEHDDISSH